MMIKPHADVIGIHRVEHELIQLLPGKHRRQQPVVMVSCMVERPTGPISLVLRKFIERRQAHVANPISVIRKLTVPTVIVPDAAVLFMRTMTVPAACTKPVKLMLAFGDGESPSRI